jgi:glucan endo-1,3-beta-D-glucosidase
MKSILPILPPGKMLSQILPTLTSTPSGLQGPFESPNVIVSFERGNTAEIVGDGYTAHLSPATSTFFVFDVHPEHQGKMCSLAFHVPPSFAMLDLAPVQIQSPGGIEVFRLIDAGNVGDSSPVGSVSSIEFGSQYDIGNARCEAGQRVAYRVDSTGGLSMHFFQMVSPPLGLFMSVSE